VVSPQTSGHRHHPAVAAHGEGNQDYTMAYPIVRVAIFRIIYMMDKTEWVSQSKILMKVLNILPLNARELGIGYEPANLVWK
jgi:hypothetical protein